MKEIGEPGGNPHRSELRIKLGTFYSYSIRYALQLHTLNIRAEYSLILGADLIQTFPVHRRDGDAFRQFVALSKCMIAIVSVTITHESEWKYIKSNSRQIRYFMPISIHT